MKGFTISSSGPTWSTYNLVVFYSILLNLNTLTLVFAEFYS
ncbi:hypothetical protein SAMN05428642_101835 [Flaviramulus basaltis]|uniref:Uncharacterized protein n=1 Tax=Flaviramulus basaltis TaxID=369401 RepID=A0A1K2IDB8_9FLAO|nr:hypothetical protein SAMN05428642_101835 [Flaviramulus basaltis]